MSKMRIALVAFLSILTMFAISFATIKITHHSTPVGVTFGSQYNWIGPPGDAGTVPISNGIGQVAGWGTVSGGSSFEGGIENAPFDLNMHELSQAATGMTGDAGALAPRNLVPLFQFQPSSMVTLNEQFTTTTLTRFTTYSEGTPLTPTISGGQITFANTSGQNTFLAENSGLTGNGLVVPQFAVRIHLASQTYGTGNSYDNPGVGICQDSNNYMIAGWEPDNSPQQFAIRVKIGGSGNWRTAVTWSTAPPFDMGLALVSNTLTSWLSTNGGTTWNYQATWQLTEVDMRGVTLSNWRPCFSYASAATVNSTSIMSNFQFGSFGTVGVRDISPVTNLDGTIPLSGTNSATATYTATFMDPNGAAYNGVFTYDHVARTFTQTGVNFINRSGLVYNDNASQLIHDGTGGYHHFITSWGNTGASNIFIQYKHETSINLAAGVNAEGSMTVPTVPAIPSGGGAYDPHAVCPPSMSPNCYFAYTIGPNCSNCFYPALATATSIGASSWTAVGQDLSALQYEGTRIWLLNGSYYALAGSINDSNVYDLNMNYVGKFASLVETTTGFPAHPNLVPVGSFIYDLTFDNTEFNSTNGTQGNLRVFRALRYHL